VDGFTEQMLKRLDNDVKKNFGVSLAAILEEPSTYINQKGFAVKLSRITDYVDAENRADARSGEGEQQSLP